MRAGGEPSAATGNRSHINSATARPYEPGDAERVAAQTKKVALSGATTVFVNSLPNHAAAPKHGTRVRISPF
jgi:urease beta subunit